MKIQKMMEGDREAANAAANDLYDKYVVLVRELYEKATSAENWGAVVSKLKMMSTFYKPSHKPSDVNFCPIISGMADMSNPPSAKQLEIDTRTAQTLKSVSLGYLRLAELRSDNNDLYMDRMVKSLKKAIAISENLPDDTVFTCILLSRDYTKEKFMANLYSRMARGLVESSPESASEYVNDAAKMLGESAFIKKTRAKMVLVGALRAPTTDCCWRGMFASPKS
jgi:hypothetical protein